MLPCPTQLPVPPLSWKQVSKVTAVTPKTGSFCKPLTSWRCHLAPSVRQRRSSHCSAPANVKARLGFQLGTPPRAQVSHGHKVLPNSLAARHLLGMAGRAGQHSTGCLQSTKG